MIAIDEHKLDIINKSYIIPPKPEILHELQYLMKMPEPDLNRIAQTVASDVGVSAAVLKLINSPAFGLSRSVADIKQAVMFIGINGIHALVQGLKLKEAFSLDKSCINLGRFWDNSFMIANACMYFGKMIKAYVPVEDLYTLGLFHDAGIPAMAIKHADYSHILQQINMSDGPGLDLEERHYNTNHAIVGYFLACSWHLPRTTCQLILHHHDWSFFEGQHQEVNKLSLAVLKLSENVINETKRFVSSPDWHYQREQVLETLALTVEDYEDIKQDFLDDVEFL